MNNTQFYKAKEVTKLLGVSRWTLTRMIESQQFPKPIQLNRRSMRWPITEVDGWLQQRAQERGEVRP